MSGGAELYGPQMVKQSCLPHGKSKEASGMREGARKGRLVLQLRGGSCGNKWEWEGWEKQRAQNVAFHNLDIQTESIKLWVIGSAFVHDPRNKPT